MPSEVLSFLGSLLVGLLSLAGIIYSTSTTRKVYEAVNDEKLKAISLQIKALEDKQDKHNSVIERMYNHEKKQASIEKDIETLQADVKEVKKDIEHIKSDVGEVKNNIQKMQIKETQLEGKLTK